MLKKYSKLIPSFFSYRISTEILSLLVINTHDWDLDEDKVITHCSDILATLEWYSEDLWSLEDVDTLLEGGLPLISRDAKTLVDISQHRSASGKSAYRDYRDLLQKTKR